MRRWCAGFALSGLLAGCSMGPDDDVVTTMALAPFDACADALDHLKQEAHDRVGPWGLTGGSVLAFGAVPEMATSDSATAIPDQDHSTTNVQEIGVDEPDVVKTDGELIVTVKGADLRVVDVTGDTPREVGRLPLGEENADARVLLADNRALVLVRDNVMVGYDVAPGFTGVVPGQTTKVLLVDLSEPAEPVVESTLEVDGDYLDARMIDDTVRLVTTSRPRLDFPVTDGVMNGDEDDMISRNREVIADSTIEDWLPTYRLSNDDGEASGTLVPCDRLNRPDEFAGFSTLSVLTIDLDDGLSPGDAVGVLTDGDTVYASLDRLYVATTEWTASPGESTILPRPPADPSTGIHAFDISGDPARYVASGTVKGTIIGRYAMSEHDGILRVATTVHTGPSWESTESQLLTLDERGDELVQVGQVGGLGKGEQIYAVRYFGDTGYVVTFRQIDPLYVLDLSDPANPAVTGELKITGYSAYLHDVGEGRLVGVGQEATSDGRSVGAQVSLFDVSDPTAPAKLDGHVVPDAWAHAEWDPHAFLYWSDTRQLVVPIEGAESGGGALVLEVGDGSVSEQGVVTHGGPAHPDYAWLTRSLVVGDTLYTLWEDGLQANGLDGLEFRHWLPLA